MSTKTYKYRIYPTKSQKTILENTLEECRLLYNNFIVDRKQSWENHKKSISGFDQQNQLPLLKKQRPSFNIVYSQVLQNVANRVDLAFKAFFRRVKKGETPGYPRFKGEGRYRSITYPQNNLFKIVDNNRIHLSKIGSIKIRLHRQPEGILKTCTIRKTSTGKWFVYLVAEVQPVLLPTNLLEVGIDMGLKTFAMLSDKSKINNPRFFTKEQKSLAKVQRKADKWKLKKRSPEKQKVYKAVAKVHERISNKRHNFIHQESKKLVDKYGILCVEDLAVKELLEKKEYSKSIADASWSMFLSQLQYKAENAGRVVVKVNPAYTTQDCSRCGNRKKLKLSDRKYECDVCGLNIDRDLNASRNILSVGLHTLRTSIASKSPAA